MLPIEMMSNFFFISLMEYASLCEKNNVIKIIKNLWRWLMYCRYHQFTRLGQERQFLCNTEGAVAVQPRRGFITK